MNTKIGKWVVTSVVALVLLLACIKEEPIIHVTSVTLEKNELELTEGDNHKLSVIVLPEDATNASVSWESSNTDVATVDAKGLITALKPGTVEITVTTEDGEKTAVCKVTVAPRFIHVVSVSISPEKLTLTEGNTHSLTTTVLPAEATNPKVMWSSADSTIATVNEMGELTALKAGIVTITATSEDGGKTALCEVTVEAKIIEVESVRLSEEQITLVEGNTYSLTATVLPADATNKNIHWTSENEAVVTINEGGLLTAHKVGTATVVVTTESGKKTAICRVTVEAKVIAVESVSLSEEQITLVEGNTYSLTATVLPANATNKKVTWTSANTAIATVDDLGKVTGVASGTVYITATTEDSKKTATCKVTVSKKVITVAYVSLDNETITLLEGDTKTLVATVSPTNATNKKITWTTTDKTIATVDANGKVTAITAGVVSITATTEDGGKKASCRVTVEKNIVAVTNVSIQPESIVLAIGNQRQLSATVSPTNATNKKVTWTSADPSIATVTANGKVTGVASGTVYITATTEDGGKKASCKVTVESVIAVTNVSIQPETITLPVGDELQLTATVSPTNATNKKVTWTTANAGIAKVDNHGKVTGVASGTVYITATTEDGGKTATCKVSVTTPIIQVTSINIQPGTATVTVGGEQQLTANVLPTNATNKAVTWTSGNTSIATVSSSGKVTGVASGTVYITATTEDGGKTATCKVSVTTPIIQVTSINIQPGTATVTVGGEQQLTANVLPTNATNKAVTWTSGNTSIATVDANGKVTAVGTGTAYITATSTDGGGKTATCVVKITNEETPKMVLKTTANSLNLVINADPQDQNGVWIDLNNNGQKDTGENVTSFSNNLYGTSTNYVINNQVTSEKTITIYGKVTSLTCNFCGLTSLDVSKNKSLVYLVCDYNQLTNLDVSGNTNLVFLNCFQNQLTKLDISKNTDLVYFYCNKNQLTNLNISKNMNLKTFFCSNNKLTDLDISKNTSLEIFDCSHNQLTSLDISKNINMKSLRCIDNQLTNLDITKNTKLNHITIINNNLTPASKQKIVDDLPTRSASEQARFGNYNSQEFSQSQLNTIRAKGWTVVN